MRTTTATRSTAVLATLATALLSIAPTSPLAAQKQQGAAATGGNAAAIAAVRAALDKYKDPVAAIRDGYLSTVGCIDFPGGTTEHAMQGMTMNYKPGAMGVHLLNMGLVGPKLDSTKPQVLLYEPVGDKLVLAGAEWFMPAQLSKTPPTVLGHQLMGPMEGHAPIMPAELHHWDLHVWLWKTNRTECSSRPIRR